MKKKKKEKVDEDFIRGVIYVDFIQWNVIRFSGSITGNIVTFLFLWYFWMVKHYFDSFFVRLGKKDQKIDGEITSVLAMPMELWNMDILSYPLEETFLDIQVGLITYIPKEDAIGGLHKLSHTSLLIPTKSKQVRISDCKRCRLILQFTILTAVFY